MEKQKTIKNEVELQGTGLNTGNKVTLKFKPSPPNSGINFVRVDLASKPIINAEVANLVDISKSPRHTSLGSGDVWVQTVEHLMAALSGLGIDNILIEINSNELPAMDGSSLPFIEALKKAGLSEQEAAKKSFIIREPLWVEDESAYIVVFPSNEFKITYTLNYENLFIGSQYLNIPVTPEIFEKELAPARTFCLQKEVEALLSLGLGKGANYENTLVVSDGGVLKNKLRFNDEFVRHKALDLLGDLYLLGFSVKGHVIAVRSGHNLNIKLIHKIKQKREKWMEGSMRPADELKVTGTELDINVIKRILPHRYPFLLVDKIVMMEAMRIVGVKNVTANEEFFQGHFPGRPIMPGVLIVEAMAQTAGILMLSRNENFGKLAYFTGIDNVRFRKTVVPGEQLVMEIQVTRFKSRTGQARAEAKVDGKLVCEADLMFALVEA
ncbi:MAG: UDP-3-O-acyl-N-acetylglucosamine deacetylase [Candidatus Omnitrophica bacterium]|nr:UDP-3-O-acyl-N-acetylglucosamine deacetylase [Candidatus Omnitrophota bacterium]